MKDSKGAGLWAFTAVMLLAVGGCTYHEEVRRLDSDRDELLALRQIEADRRMALEGERVVLEDMVRVAETIQQVRRVGGDKQAVIRALALRGFGELVASSMKELEGEYLAKKDAVRRQATARVAEVRKKPVATPVQRAAVEAEVAQIKEEEKGQLAALDEDWRKAAVVRTKEKYGTEFAVPVRTGGDAAVVFVNVRGEGDATVRDTAWRVNASESQVVQGARQGNGAVRHQGRDNLLLAATPVDIGF